MGQGVSILALEPRWIESPRHRYGLGISLRCPEHLGACRILLHFSNPADGEPPIDGVPLYRRDGGALESISVFVGRTYRPIEVVGHWRGYIQDGFVYPARDPSDDEDEVVTEPAALPALGPGTGGH